MFFRHTRKPYDSRRNRDSQRPRLRWSATPRRPYLESLEKRCLLAGDLPDPLAFMHSPLAQHFGRPGEVRESAAANSSALLGEGEFGSGAGSGETGLDADPDLVAFAQSLEAAGVQLYCAAWDETCTQQLEIFEDGGKHIRFVEVTDENRELTDEATTAGITSYPTWEFSDGSRLAASLTLAEISAESNVGIPLGAAPSFAALGDQTVAIRSPLHLPIDGYDPNGGELTVTVSSGDESLLTAEVLQGNRSLNLSLAGYGDMVFELFEGRAPRPTGRVIELAESGFYDSTIFHRIIEDFVIQGGDPTGTGRGGSTLGDFDDQYHLDLQHNAPGILSYAKSNDDTNDSQFFITDEPLRFLDFNHSVFGTLTEGGENRLALEKILTDQDDLPVFDVVLESATVFEDLENSVVVLRPTGEGTGSVSLTVTVTDEQGNEFSEVIEVAIGEDTANGAPFLNPIGAVETCPGQAVDVQLTSQDKEGDEVEYGAQRLGEINYELELDSATGLVTVTPPTGFVGQLSLIVGVRQTSATTTSSTIDSQVFTIDVRSSHQNSVDQFDVNDDEFVTPIDALLIINHLNESGVTEVDLLTSPPPFLDVNADCSVSPIDALLVINRLNSGGEGEGAGLGESADQLLADARMSSGAAGATSQASMSVPLEAFAMAPSWLDLNGSQVREEERLRSFFGW
jgi:cyclophilin family peptidyl-prolyl cis-trans isomerase